MTHPFPPTALWRRHAKMVRDSSSIYKIEYFILVKNSLNPEGHTNCLIGSKVTAIFLNGGICLLIEGLPCLVFRLTVLKK